MLYRRGRLHRCDSHNSISSSNVIDVRQYYNCLTSMTLDDDGCVGQPVTWSG